MPERRSRREIERWIDGLGLGDASAEAWLTEHLTGPIEVIPDDADATATSDLIPVSLSPDYVLYVDPDDAPEGVDVDALRSRVR